MRFPLLAGLALALVTGGANAPMPAPVTVTCDDDPLLATPVGHSPNLGGFAFRCNGPVLAFADTWRLVVDDAPPGSSLYAIVESMPPAGGETVRDVPLSSGHLVRAFPASDAATGAAMMLLDAPWLLVEAGLRPAPIANTAPEPPCDGACGQVRTTPTAPASPRRAVPEPPMLALLLPGLALAAGPFAVHRRAA